MRSHEILRINVTINKNEIVTLSTSNDKSVTMIPFSGTVEGDYFTGTILPGGVDTQIKNGADKLLSARYFLEGIDKCKIYIDNTGLISSKKKEPNTPFFRANPKVITDSEILDFLNNAFLISEGFSSIDGVTIIIYSTDA